MANAWQTVLGSLTLPSIRPQTNTLLAQQAEDRYPFS